VTDEKNNGHHHKDKSLKIKTIKNNKKTAERYERIQ
jgi:hypothetical protein